VLLTYFGLHDPNFRQVQRDFEIRWRYFTPQFDLVRNETAPWFIPLSKTPIYRDPRELPKSPKSESGIPLAPTITPAYLLLTSSGLQSSLITFSCHKKTIFTTHG
jgi:hypothetical protein